MAFFDKLRDVAELAKNKIQDAIQIANQTAAQSGLIDKSHPLADETVKKYYEIAYGLFASMEDGYVDFDGTKKYIEHCTGEECDVEKLQKALSYYGRGASYTILTDEYTLKYVLKDSVPPSDINKLIEVNKELAQSSNYRCTREEALEICYDYTKIVAEATESIKLEYEKVLDIVATKGIRFYKEGVDRIVESIPGKYRIMVGNNIVRVLVDKTMVKRIINEITRKKMFEDNATVKEVLLGYTHHILKGEQKRHYVASVALRAAHFEKNEQNEQAYSGINDEDCRNFILIENSFSSEVDDHPYDTEKIIEEYIDSIKYADIFRGGEFRNYWMPDERDDTYYADMVCNIYWKDIAAGEGVDHIQEADAIYNILFEHIQQ